MKHTSREVEQIYRIGPARFFTAHYESSRNGTSKLGFFDLACLSGIGHHRLGRGDLGARGSHAVSHDFFPIGPPAVTIRALDAYDACDVIIIKAKPIFRFLDGCTLLNAPLIWR